ncbi:heavy metal-associated isoprenylated plant protein 46-like [Aristolochia californica]|uniref:heavy metal-associated isoprenylated plant protein 46-like n=1 Tax=Aristolochia californica TaxID=171875 RepID=UPI0035DA5471
MKQKMVIRAQMTDTKERSKAMKIAVGVPGVISVGIEGKDKDQMVVIGEEVDVVGLTRLVRKKMCFAELVSVSVIEEKKEEKKVASTAEIVALPAPWTYPANWSHPANIQLSVSDYPAKYDDTCSIM